jgi:outer membrane immunogenic protein
VEVSSQVFGGQLGYNLQTGNWVWGIEVDVDGANLRTNRSVTIPAGVFTPFPGGTAFLNIRQNWVADLHGKIGYTWGPGMIYANFGIAWTGLEITGGATLFGATPVVGSFTADQIRRGTVMGVGYEWMIAPNWATRFEYMFYNHTGAIVNSTTLPAASTTLNSATGKLHDSIVRIGLDYKFDWGAPVATRY